MPGVVVTYDGSVTGQQKQWCEDAMALAVFPWDDGDLNVTVQTVAEPPCAGHSDYMCTEVTGTDVQIYIRDGADDPAQPFNENAKDSLKSFFMSSFMHEIVGHGFTFAHLITDDLSRERMIGFFTRKIPGESPTGVLADWNPLDKPWEDRVQEGVAEFLKDLYLPETIRWSDNRTHWSMNEIAFNDLLGWIDQTACNNASGGGGGIPS